MVAKFHRKIMNTIASLIILIAVVQSVLVVISLVGWWRGVDNVAFPGLGLIVATPAIIVLFLILNVIFVIAAAFIKPPKDSVSETRAEQDFEYPNDIFSGCGNGTLTLSLAKNPDDYDAKTDRWLYVCINDDDLEAISLMIFEVETGKPYIDAEHILKKRNDDRELFRRLFPAYPMLGRINYIFEDMVFTPEEVG
jgi:uncharacterized membrane protein